MATLVPRGRLRLQTVPWWVSTVWCQRTGNRSDRIQVPQLIGAVWGGLVVISGSPARSSPCHLGKGSNSLPRCVQYRLGRDGGPNPKADGAFSADVRQVGPATGRPVCVLRQQTSPQLCVTLPWSQGTVHRCMSAPWTGWVSCMGVRSGRDRLFLHWNPSRSEILQGHTSVSGLWRLSKRLTSLHTGIMDG